MNQNDEEYTIEVAKRSVARAALHLGLREMEEEVLDTLAEILLGYMHQFGKVVGQAAESSQRSSAHANLLDALQAVEVCAPPPSVAQARVVSSSTSSSSNQQGIIKRSSMGTTSRWQDLCEFIFGRNWRQSSKSPNNNSTKQQAVIDDIHSNGKIVNGNHKAGSSSTTTNGAKNSTITTTMTATTTSKQHKEDLIHRKGWSAPYPDYVPEYPVRLKVKGNATQVVSEVAAARDGTKSSSEIVNDMEKETSGDNGDDDVLWGSISQSCSDAMDIDKSNETSSTKRKRDESDRIIEKKKRYLDETPLYVPDFFPPYPPPNTYKKHLRDPGETADGHASQKSKNKKESKDSVRSTLIQFNDEVSRMRRSSREDKDDGNSSKQLFGSVSASAKVLFNSAVPTGVKPFQQKERPPGVAPLARPSNAKVAKIVEGSLDVS